MYKNNICKEREKKGRKKETFSCRNSLLREFSLVLNFFLLNSKFGIAKSIHHHSLKLYFVGFLLHSMQGIYFVISKAVFLIWYRSLIIYCIQKLLKS